MSLDAPVVEEIREVIATLPHPVKISDLHVWRVGNGAYACVISLVTEAAFDADYYRQAIQVHEELVHVTVEIHQHHAVTTGAMP